MTTTSHRRPPPPTAAATDHAGRLARRDALPFAISVFQFAIAIGATIAASDVDPRAALAGTAILSAGASQLAAIELVDAGVGVTVAAATALLINARFAVYGAGFARWFAAAPRWQRYLMVFPIVDQSYLLCEARFADQEDLDWRRRYYLAVISALFAAFAAGQIIGYFAGDLIPDQFGVEMAAPIVFAGLLALATTTRTATVAALGAGSAMFVVAAAPSGLGLPVAATIGLAAGSLAADRARSEVGS